jgi:hypothetical protein
MNCLEYKATLRLGTVAVIIASAIGCETPSANTFSRNYGLRGDLPVDAPGPHPEAEGECTDGGRLWRQYCGSCHNARPLGERPFANYHVAIAHMRDQAYLTGEEYRKIIMFVRQWQGVGPATPDVDPSPKRFEFSQPIAELRPEPTPGGAVPPPRPAPSQSRAPHEAPEPTRNTDLPGPLP